MEEKFHLEVSLPENGDGWSFNDVSYMLSRVNLLWRGIEKNGNVASLRAAT